MPMNVNKINQNNDYKVGKPKINTEYSSIKMGNTQQGSGNMGLLIPGHIHEMLPSQKINLNQSIGIQFNPFVTNLFHEINGEMLSYFVPFRLLWDDWETFIMGGIDGEDATAHPTISLKTLWEETNVVPGDRTLLGTLADYFNMPISWDFANEEVLADKPSAFPWYAYNKIYNDHIRLIDFEPTEIDEDNNELLRGNYDWDYFTRCRAYQQRGVVPSVPVSDELLELEHDSVTANLAWPAANAANSAGLNYSTTALVPANAGSKSTLEAGTTTFTVPAHELTELGMNLNDFLIAMGIMRFQLNNAKIQPRYIEQLEARWGIYPQDVRQARPEYLGSNYFQVAVDTVTQTGESGTTPQGNITGQAWGSGQNMNTTYEAKEHGILFTMFIIRPKRVYEGGLDKRWIRKTRFDYATPELANLPDIEVKRQEIMYTGTVASDSVVFGWQGMYEEYRTLRNQVNGLLRPSIDGNLVSYTLADYWVPGGPPVLNKTFYGVNPDEARVKLLLDEPMFIYFLRNDIQTAIPLPLQSEPGDLSFI